MKKLFIDNGFKIVYDKDLDEPIADGFYFTFSYPGFNGEELLKELLYYGISAISLAITGSEKLEGMRACVSLVNRNQFGDLGNRLKRFNQDHGKTPLKCLEYLKCLLCCKIIAAVFIKAAAICFYQSSSRMSL